MSDQPSGDMTPAERLDVLCEQIRNANEGYCMAPVLTTLRELGVPDKLDGYIVGSEGMRGAEFDRNLVLDHAANNSSVFITSAVCILEYKILCETHVIEHLPIPMLKVCLALVARRQRLHIKMS